MAGFFDLLPSDIKRYEILSKLDDISLLILRHVLLGTPLSLKLSVDQQKNIIRNGLSLTIFFWEKLDKNRICEYAAECGSLDILKYARENQCRWDKGVCRAAAKRGRLDLLKFLHESVGL